MIIFLSKSRAHQWVLNAFTNFSILISIATSAPSDVVSVRHRAKMRYAGIAPANVLPQFAYPLSGYINPLPEHLVPIALHTAYTVCPDLHMCTQETKDPHICFPIWGEFSTGLSVPWYWNLTPYLINMESKKSKYGVTHPILVKYGVAFFSDAWHTTPF